MQKKKKSLEGTLAYLNGFQTPFFNNVLADLEFININAP